MCEPCTRRTAACASTPVVRVRTSSTHGPAALTTVRARMVSRWPVAVSSIVTCQTPSARLISVARVRVLTTAPRAAASSALSRTSRASSTKQSEYSKARPNLPFASGSPVRIGREIDRSRRRQQLSAAEVIVEKQPEPQQPGGPQLPMMRKDEAQRLDDVRRHPPQHLALDQRLADQAKLIIFEVAQAAVDQLGRPGRRPARQVVHFTKENGKSASCGVAGDAAAVNSAADDGEVVDLVQALPRQSLSNVAILFRIGVDTQSKAKATGIRGSFNRRLFECRRS